MARANPVRVDDGNRHDRRRERSRRLEPDRLTRGNDGAGALGAKLRAGLGRGGDESELRIVASTVGLGEDRGARVRRGALGDRPRAFDEIANPGLVEPVRAGHADPVAVDNANLELRIVLAHILVDPVVGEPGERRVLPDVQRLRRLSGRVRQRAVEEVVDLRAGGYHRPTPTFTPRNRAGAAPWPTWPVCTGSPFPQFGTPHSVHSSALQIASQLPQNWGVMPV
jgi:hypothetical protein